MFVLTPHLNFMKLLIILLEKWSVELKKMVKKCIFGIMAKNINRHTRIPSNIKMVWYGEHLAHILGF